MKSMIALVFIGMIAATFAGVQTYIAGPQFGFAGYSTAYASPVAALPYAVTQTAYNTLASNYQLNLDTSLPGSAYAAYPYSAAPTAYGYGVYKTL